jgi:hypothetical protein
MKKMTTTMTMMMPIVQERTTTTNMFHHETIMNSSRQSRFHCLTSTDCIAIDHVLSDIMYEIDVYLEKKAEKRRGNRRRGGRNGDIDLAGPDTDRMVKKLIDQMKIATEEDRIFNKSRQPATAKLLLLPVVEQQLCRADLTEIFLDNGILTVFKVKIRQ